VPRGWIACLVFAKAREESKGNSPGKLVVKYLQIRRIPVMWETIYMKVGDLIGFAYNVEGSLERLKSTNSGEKSRFRGAAAPRLPVFFRYHDARDDGGQYRACDQLLAAF
jgi:hypothetical protein